MHPHYAWHVSPCLTSTPTLPCTPTMPTYTTTMPVTYPHHALYLTMVTCTTSIPDTYPYHTLHGPPPCLIWTTTIPDIYPSPRLACATTLPDMYHHYACHVPPPCLTCLRGLWRSCMGSEFSAGWDFSSALLLSLGDPLNLSRFLYRSKGKLIVAPSLKNMSVDLSHCLQILRKSGTAPLLLRDRRLTQWFCPTYYSNEESFHCAIGTRATRKLNYKVTSGFKARHRRGTCEVLLSFPVFFNFLFLSLIVLLCAVRPFESLLLWLTPSVIGGCNPFRRGNDRVENYKIKMNICHVHRVSRKPTHPLLSHCSSLACTCSSELPSSCTQQILPPSLLFSLSPSKQ